MKEPTWNLVDAQEEKAPIPGRPNLIERRVTKVYRASFTTGGIMSFVCPCGLKIALAVKDGFAVRCGDCGREYEFECGIRRTDAANIPPPGL